MYIVILHDKRIQNAQIRPNDRCNQDILKAKYGLSEMINDCWYELIMLTVVRSIVSWFCFLCRVWIRLSFFLLYELFRYAIVSAVSDSFWFGVPSHALSKLLRNFVRCPRSLLTARHHNLFVRWIKVVYKLHYIEKTAYSLSNVV